MGPSLDSLPKPQPDQQSTRRSYFRLHAGWLFLCGEEFAADGGLSFEQVQSAIDASALIISDPPRILDLDIARAQLAALDKLPRPTLVTCRTGPRASATVYLYAGLQAGATPDEVLARADADGAPFAAREDYRAWVADALTALTKLD